MPIFEPVIESAFYFLSVSQVRLTLPSRSINKYVESAICHSSFEVLKLMKTLEIENISYVGLSSSKIKKNSLLWGLNTPLCSSIFLTQIFSYGMWFQAQDFADISNTIPLTEDPLAYVDCNVPNFSSSSQTESMLSSGLSSLSLTPNYRDISDVSFLPPASEPVIDEIEPSEVCSAAVAPTGKNKKKILVLLNY